jgi:hypothetical protein
LSGKKPYDENITYGGAQTEAEGRRRNDEGEAGRMNDEGAAFVNLTFSRMKARLSSRLLFGG